MTDRPGRFPHTAECRDDYCVHPIQCERDAICPPSPGGQVQAEIALADIVAMYDRLAEVKPVEPIKLTRRQVEWLRAQGDVLPPTPWPFGPSYLSGVPIHLVDEVEESTPHLKGWGWPDLDAIPEPFVSSGDISPEGLAELNKAWSECLDQPQRISYLTETPEAKEEHEDV